jgi:CRISPR-associated protein Cas5h
MTLEHALVFDVWAPYANFRRVYTTTSATTYAFAPRSSIEGFIAAIMGLDSEAYPDVLNSSQISIALLSRVNKTSLSVTYTHSDFWDDVARYLKHGGELKHNRAPRSMEIIREPKYRIFFYSEDMELVSRLASKMERHQTVYTPYLGSSNMLANFHLIDATASIREIKSEDYLPISSIIPFRDKMPAIKIQKGVTIAVEHNIPAHITAKRELQYSYSAVYNPAGSGEIWAKDIKVYNVNYREESSNIVFIPAVGPAAK